MRYGEVSSLLYSLALNVLEYVMGTRALLFISLIVMLVIKM